MQTKHVYHHAEPVGDSANGTIALVFSILIAAIVIYLVVAFIRRDGITTTPSNSINVETPDTTPSTPTNPDLNLTTPSTSTTPSN